MSTTAVNDAPSWEAQKENAAPLERGRNVASLGLRQSDVDKLDLTKKTWHYEQLVRPTEDPKIKQMDSDPLADWLSYIKFYQNSFPSDTRENFLIIERCVRALAKMKQYNNDDRFVSVCAKYADKTKDPGQVFKYLHQQKIGGHVALFWIAWAFVAEKENDFPFADKIFKKGISKKAEPFQMLVLRHQQFQRRMSRYWLNSSKPNDELNDEYDTGEQNRSSRSMLGFISSDRFHRNGNNRVREDINNSYSTRNQNNTRRFGNTPNSMNVNSKGSFNIFVEEGGENHYNLDQEFSQNDRAVIARDRDRRKENLLAAKRWNEHGGIYQNTKVSAPRSMTPLSAFSVFVDEECATTNKHRKQQQQAKLERQRQVRDERTFRNRDQEGMAEKIFRDPVRFLKDPGSYSSENLFDHRSENLKTEETKQQQKSRAGFSKRQLRNEIGEEQCFEEARARFRAYNRLIASSINFNKLENMIHLDQNSKKDLDNESGMCMDMSMSDSLSTSMQVPTSGEQSIRRGNLQCENKGKKIFQHLDRSFDTILNQTGTSNASSKINYTNTANVGVAGKQEEETINTKFAMRELSMMFSSPGVEYDCARKEDHDNSNASLIKEAGAYTNSANVSFGNVGDGILLDNSLCNMADEKVHDDRKPFTECTSLDGVMCAKNVSKTSKERLITFQDHTNVGKHKNSDDAKSVSGFYIFGKENEDGCTDRSTQGSRGKIIESNFPFQIFEEKEDNEDKTTKNNIENGDTASIGDAIALLDEKLEINDTNSVSSKKNSHQISNEGDETVTVTLFNKLFQTGSGNIDDETESISAMKGVEIRLHPEHRFPQNKVPRLTTSKIDEKRFKRSFDDTQKVELDYSVCIARNTEVSMKGLQRTPAIPAFNTPSFAPSSSRKKSFYFPTITIPKQLRKMNVSNTKISIGTLRGLLLKKELGRGTYGRVLLVSPSDSHSKRMIAMKVQSPTGSLAWEFVVLQRLERRLLLEGTNVVDYAFPRPVNFISFADGGALSMSAVSETGLNLVDLSNFYTLKLGRSAPELIAFHYTSVALRIVEQLHWQGKILHCDVKPDNFVLSNFNCCDNICRSIDYAYLTLVDFGNAIDLTHSSGFGTENHQNIFFYGIAARKDMQCIAMRNGQSWSYDADTFGILCCAHLLLYGEHLTIKKDRIYGWVPSKSLKRYWKQDLWKDIFGTLLNLNDLGGSSIGSFELNLRRLRERIDAHLETEDRTLCDLLSRQASLLPNQREKIK